MAFQEAVCCDKIDFGGLELPHSPNFTPRFTAFNCVVDDKLAPHTRVKMCSKCGLNKIIPRGCPIMESLSSKKVRWNKRIETPYKTKKDEWSTKVTRYTFVQSCLSSFRDPFVFVHFLIPVRFVVESTEGTHRITLGTLG